MVDMAAIREGFERQDIAELGLIKSENNLADGPKKIGFCLDL
jgi:hypothetical protein